MREPKKSLLRLDGDVCRRTEVDIRVREPFEREQLGCSVARAPGQIQSLLQCLSVFGLTTTPKAKLSQCHEDVRQARRVPDPSKPKRRFLASVQERRERLTQCGRQFGGDGGQPSFERAVGRSSSEFHRLRDRSLRALEVRRLKGDSRAQAKKLRADDVVTGRCEGRVEEASRLHEAALGMPVTACEEHHLRNARISTVDEPLEGESKVLRPADRRTRPTVGSELRENVVGVAPSYPVVLRGFLELLECELAHDLQHVKPRLLWSHAGDEVVVDERFECLECALADIIDRGQVRRPGKDSEPAEECLLFLVQELVTRLEGRSQRLLAGWQVARASPRECQPPFEQA